MVVQEGIRSLSKDEQLVRNLRHLLGPGPVETHFHHQHLARDSGRGDATGSSRRFRLNQSTRSSLKADPRIRR